MGAILLALPSVISAIQGGLMLLENVIGAMKTGQAVITADGAAATDANPAVNAEQLATKVAQSVLATLQTGDQFAAAIAARASAVKSV